MKLCVLYYNNNNKSKESQAGDEKYILQVYKNMKTATWIQRF